MHKASLLKKALFQNLKSATGLFWYNQVYHDRKLADKITCSFYGEAKSSGLEISDSRPAVINASRMATGFGRI
jgi:hypothetical protein